MSRFNFTGKIRINAADAKYPSFRSGKTKNGDPYKSATLFINPAENNSGVADIFGMKQDEIKTKSKDNEDIVVDWDDRKDKAVLDKVAVYKKNVISVGEDRKEFLSSYDLIDYIEENIDEIQGKVFTIVGRSRINEYNGTISDRFSIQNIYEVPEDKVSSKKQGLSINDVIYFNKDSFDFADLKEEGKIRIDGYTKEWVDKKHPEAYVAKQFVIDCSKIDWEDEMNVKRFNATFRPLGLVYKDDKVKSVLKAGKYYSMAVNIKMINGAEAEDFTIDMLTDAQRELVELGIKELEDFRPKGNVYGNRIHEYKITSCDLSVDDYKDGEITEVEESASEFEDNIYATTPKSNKEVEESIDEELDMNPPAEKVEKKEKEKKSKTKPKPKPEPEEEDGDDEDDELADLFD